MLRLEAPLMSFGGVLVDQHNSTDRFPGRAMVTGLIANALGWNHCDFEMLNGLQRRVAYAARWDVSPHLLRDYHTVDLGQPHLREGGWTTHGHPEHREGGAAARFGTHQRYRHYWADGVLTMALTLDDGDPGLDLVYEAFLRPARPLFFGRKCCLPSAPVALGVRSAAGLLVALQAEPAHPRAGSEPAVMDACWPPGEADMEVETRQRHLRTDDRDWSNQVHVGLRAMVDGEIRGIGNVHD